MTMTTTGDLLATIGAHLAAFELPAIASVPVAAAISAPQVTVQLARHDPAAITRGQLVWPDTLTQGTAETWRVPQGESAHLSVTELLPYGALTRIYGGLQASAPGLGADLAPDPITTIPLPALRHPATLREVTA